VSKMDRLERLISLARVQLLSRGHVPGNFKHIDSATAFYMCPNCESVVHVNAARRARVSIGGDALVVSCASSQISLSKNLRSMKARNER
jgi:RNase P subunit RPR2